MRIKISGLGVLAIVVPALLATPAQAKSDKDDEQKVVCKRDAKTGTRFAKVTCRTRAEWEQIAEQHRRDYSETRDRPQIDIRRGN